MFDEAVTSVGDFGVEVLGPNKELNEFWQNRRI